MHLYNYRVKFAKNGKVLIPEDFHTALIATTALFENRESVLRFLGH